MNYQEFKKAYMKTLTEEIKGLGFIKGRGTRPTYWRYPCDDERLTWVVCYNFSARGNPIYDILMGPYWESYRLQSDSPFPACVGYSGNLNEGGPDGSSSRDATVASFEQSICDLRDFGIPYLQQFSSPEELLRLKPNGILAYDLGKYDVAVPLLKEKLANLYEGQYNITALSKAGRVMHAEDAERTEAMLAGALRKLGRPVAAVLDEAKLEGAKRMLSYAESALPREPRSRWLKSTIKQCRADIESLST